MIPPTNFPSLYVLWKYPVESNLEWMNEWLPYNEFQRHRGWLKLFWEVKPLATTEEKASVAPAPIER
jgi:hypothetical protein